ncbi:MAG TPA: hypothetical protein VMU40_01770 [Steroidobacteraceae bacterium]|nr:hypothetical protein [Steroidobacteraceae bacterium]
MWGAAAVFTLGVLIGSPAFAHQFNNSDFLSYSQVEWGEDPTPTNIAGVLQNNFDSVFAADGDLLQVGLSSPSGYSLLFDSAEGIENFLPSGGIPGPLTVSLLDPIQSSAGALGGEVVTLALNVTFGDAGVIEGNLHIPFGDLILTGLSGDVAVFNGINVRSLLGDAETILGGGPLPDPSLSYQDFFFLINDVDQSFNTGPVSSFADTNLELPPGAAPVPETGGYSTLGDVLLLLGTVAVTPGRRIKAHLKRATPE